MKVLLVRPFYYIDKEDCPYVFRETLGLEYLASYVRDDCDVEIFDMLGIYWNKYEDCEWDPNLMRVGGNLKNLFSKINETSPEIIGITSTFLTERDALLKLTKAIRTNYPEIKIVVGGSHPSCIGKELLKSNPNIDILIIGEGEGTLKELIQKKFKNLRDIKGLIFKEKDGRIVSNSTQAADGY